MSRTPDQRLVNKPQAIRLRLHALQKQAGQLAICTPATTEHEWGRLLSSFRVLTMSVTASGSSLDPALAILVYEAAADAACNADDWELFHLFRTRLCSDLYPVTHSKRELDFKEYSLLFFGCRVQDMLQVTSTLLNLTVEQLATPTINRAIECVRCVNKTNNGVRFLELYDACDAISKRILSHQVDPMRQAAAACILTAYRSIQIEYAQSLLRFDNPQATRQALFAMKPGLEEVNADFQPSDTVVLRVNR